VRYESWTISVRCLDYRGIHASGTVVAMTTIIEEASTSTPLSGPDDAALVSWAAGLGGVLAANAARHDADGTWVADSYGHLRDAGMLALAVPTELGGRGATIRQTALVMRELAHHCGSTALAMSMHQHSTAFLAWRYRHGMADAEVVLRRIARDDLVIVSTGGADFTRPRGQATRVEGGVRVSGRKIFASQSVAGSVMSALFPVDGEAGRRVLSVTIPLDDPGVIVHDNWNTLGMRGTASNDVTVTDVFVPDELIGPDRPYGVIDPPLQLIGSFAVPIISAVYLGVAESAYRAAVAVAASKSTDPVVERTVGLMSTRLRVAAWALDGALRAVSDDPQPSMETFAAVLAAKREIALAGVEVCDLAMEVAGGAAFFKGSVIERAYRDVRAAKFHPLTPELSLVHAGRLALGLPGDEL
jgi:alkylation response protein AidB-like acyl-CoA dehydrogenase